MFRARSQGPHRPAHGRRGGEAGPRTEGGGALPHLLPVPDQPAHEDRLQQRDRAAPGGSGHGRSILVPPACPLSPPAEWLICAPPPLLSSQISSTLSWSLYELSRHQAVQASLREEVLGVLGGRRVPTAADVAQMPLLKATIKEVLR